MVHRLIAIVSLAGAAAAVVVVVLLAGGGGGDSSTPARRPAAPGGARQATRVEIPAVPAVRNASPQPGWRPYAGALPILRYHAIGTAPPGETYPELFVTAADFRAQLDWLEAHGYEAVDLETVEDAWFGAGKLPAKPVVLSFDGIHGHFLDVVVPELRQRGWPGDLVVDAEVPRLRLAALAKLVALGWSLEPSGRDPAAARRAIRSRLLAPADNFAFPLGATAGGRAAALKAAGYRGATVDSGGFASPAGPFALPRITIFNASRVSGFAEAMRSHGNGVGA
jgi:peptidoglycan/xylan/chitin deacetylase (PgdA/CDA1 family)